MALLDCIEDIRIVPGQKSRIWHMKKHMLDLALDSRMSEHVAADKDMMWHHRSVKNAFRIAFRTIREIDRSSKKEE